jgi:acyl-CoA synthetase (AMP-forming)/AMP-acid ligase II
MFRFTDQLAKAARIWPDKPAITCAAGTFTWAELQRRSTRLAAALSDAGVVAGDRVGFLGFNGHLGVETLFACPMIGAAAVPLNFRLAPAELISTLNDCCPSVIIVDAAHETLLAECLPHCPSIQYVFCADPAHPEWTSYEAALAAPHPSPSGLASAGDDMLVIFYTGGTTGSPKGVMLSHTNIFCNALAILTNWDVYEAEAYAVTGPLFHSAAGARVFGATLMGTHIILQPKFDIPDLLGKIETHRISVAQFVPTMIAMILDHADFAKYDTSSLRMITYGAAPMQPELLSRAMSAFPGVRFAQAFGMTEASPIVTTLNPDDHDELTSTRLYSVGRAIAFDDLAVVDENDTPLPPDTVGEIVVRGPNIMLGYWQKPEMTAEAMRNGWYHTGDAGFVDTDGYVFLSGRIKEMSITGGENVYPIDVERVLDAHPQVRQVAVIGLPDPKWGERVHAVVEVTGDVTADDLIVHCRDRLAHYKCPKTVTLSTEPLPLTKVNKIDKIALKKALAGDSGA